MKWFKKPRDLYDLLLLEDLFFGNAGSFARRVPGGWVFYHSTAPAGIVGGITTGTFVPFSDEFLNLSDEEVKSMADHGHGMDDSDLSEEEDPDTGKIGHQSRPDGQGDS